MRDVPTGSRVRLRDGENVKMFLSSCCGIEIEIDKDGKALPPCAGPTCSDPDAASWHLLATVHYETSGANARGATLRRDGGDDASLGSRVVGG